MSEEAINLFCFTGASQNVKHLLLLEEVNLIRDWSRIYTVILFSDW